MNGSKVQLENNTECDVVVVGNIGIKLYREDINWSEACPKVKEELNFLECPGFS